VNEISAKLGRMVFALPFGVFAVLHFAMAPKLAGIVPGYLPGGVVWVYIIGVAMLAACLALASGFFARPAAYGLALLMLTFVVTIDIPGLSSSALRELSLSNLLKDLSLCGGALMAASISSTKTR
jgi:putative oxidoreductase